MVALIAAAAGLCGWATLGSASRRAPDVGTEVAPSRPEGSIESLRSALARAVLSQGAQPRTTSEPEQADDAPAPSDSETTNDGPEEKQADDTEASEASSAPESSEDSDDSTDHARLFLARLRRWRSYYYRHYRPYWYEGSYDTGSYEAANDEEGPSGGWTIPGGTPSAQDQAPSSGQGAVNPCPLDPRRWLVRLQGRPLSAEPGAGLVCLTGSASSSAGAERLWLLGGLLRLIARASPAPDRLALVVHGAALGVLILPSLEGDAGRLAANLRVLGLGDQDARAAAVVSAFGSRPVGPSHQRKVVAIDRDLSLVVMAPSELAALVASEQDGSRLRRVLGIEPSSAADRDELPADGLMPALPENTAVGVELDGCPAPRRLGDDVAPVSRALCVGDGQLVGGGEGNRPTMFYEVEATHDPPRSSAS